VDAHFSQRVSPRSPGAHSYALIGTMLAGQWAIANYMTNGIRNELKHMNARLENVEKHAGRSGHPLTTRLLIDEMKHELVLHETLHGHPQIMTELKGVEVQFAEVETQFRELRNIVHIYYRELKDWVSLLAKKLGI